jgi:serine protease
MAGILAAASNNSLGIAGVAWNVQIQPIRALGKCGGALSDIAEAIRWAAGLPVAGIPNNATPAKVVSLSLGGGDCTDNLQYMQDAVTAATAAGTVVVAATGNESNTSVIAPANCTGAIGVTAHTINGENADYANVGAGTTISAPGGGTPTQLGAGLATDDTNWTGYYVWSTLVFGDRDPNSVDASGQTGAAYAGFTGTSAATPHVAGTVALIKSVLPSATAAQVRSFLQSTARPYPAGSVCATGGALVGTCGAGLLDAGAALAAAVAIAPPSVVVPPQNVNVFEGQAASLSVVAVGANPLSYQWKLNGTNIAGATASTYTTAALSLADSGKRYSVTVSNSLGTVTTPEATVTVSTPPPPQSGGGGGALPLGQLLLLAALLLAARIQRRI